MIKGHLQLGTYVNRLLHMAKEDKIKKNPDYVSTSEAAEMLGLSYYRVFEYVEYRRLPATLVGRMYMIPRKAVEEFKPQPTGRVRKKPPAWKEYRGGSRLFASEVRVSVREGQQEKLIERLNAIREANQHPLTGTVQRFVIAEDELLTSVLILLVWRDIEMPDEMARQKEFAAFKEELADVLDWETATESIEKVLLHT
jgi:excisionase family DNA binding protein